jgi:hypothetical protein
MNLKPGECVQTELGEIGKVIHINQLTVFVVFPDPEKNDRIMGFLESQLTKLKPPEEGKTDDPSGRM